MDIEEYMEAEFEDCRKNYGDNGLHLMENLLSTYVLMKIISRLLKNSEKRNEIGQILAEYTSQTSIRFAKVADFDKQTTDNICERASKVVDYLDAIDHSPTSNLH